VSRKINFSFICIINKPLIACSFVCFIIPVREKREKDKNIKIINNKKKKVRNT